MFCCYVCVVGVLGVVSGRCLAPVSGEGGDPIRRCVGARLARRRAVRVGCRRRLYRAGWLSPAVPASRSGRAVSPAMRSCGGAKPCWPVSAPPSASFLVARQRHSQGPPLIYSVYRVESIYTWQCGGLAYPTQEMQGSALRRSIAGCCKKLPQATLRAASR